MVDYCEEKLKEVYNGDGEVIEKNYFTLIFPNKYISEKEQAPYLLMHVGET